MGSPMIWFGSKVKSLKSILSLNGGAELHSGTVDPTSVAVDATKGSLYLNTSNGFLYRKTDAGSTTNWSDLSAGGGANTTLSNLGVTAVNVGINPGTDNSFSLGTTAKSWATVIANGLTLRTGGQATYNNTANDPIVRVGGGVASSVPSGTTISGFVTNPSGPASGVGLQTNGLIMYTASGTSNSGASGELRFETGNNAGTTSTSGPITLKTGTGTTGRGKIVLDTSAVNVATGTADPTVATANGDLYYNSTNSVLRLYANGAWTTVGNAVSAVSNYTATATLTNADEVVLVATTADGGNMTITLPTAVGVTGKTITVKKTDAFTKIVNVAGAGGETIDGTTTKSIFMQWESLTMVSNGANWFII